MWTHVKAMTTHRLELSSNKGREDPMISLLMKTYHKKNSLHEACYLFVSLFLFFKTGFLCGFETCPGAHRIQQAGLELTEIDLPRLQGARINFKISMILSSFFLLVFVLKKVFLRGPKCPETHYVVQAYHKPTEIFLPLPLTWLMGCTITASLLYLNYLSVCLSVYLFIFHHCFVILLFLFLSFWPWIGFSRRGFSVTILIAMELAFETRLA